MWGACSTTPLGVKGRFEGASAIGLPNKDPIADDLLWQISRSSVWCSFSCLVVFSITALLDLDIDSGELISNF